MCSSILNLRTLSTSCIHYNVLNHFELQIFFNDRKDEGEPDNPKISRTLKVTQWSESFIDFTHRMIGVQGAPLVYLIREDSAVPATPPHLLMN